jgi:hypothetical protein
MITVPIAHDVAKLQGTICGWEGPFGVRCSVFDHILQLPLWSWIPQLLRVEARHMCASITCLSGVSLSYRSHCKSSSLTAPTVNRRNSAGQGSKKRKESLKVFMQAAKLDPNCNKAFTYLGHHYAAGAATLDRATRCYEKAVRCSVFCERLSRALLF